MTAYGAIDSAIESIRRGAYHYLTKPFKLDELVIFVRRALDERALRREAAELRKTLGEQVSLRGRDRAQRGDAARARDRRSRRGDRRRRPAHRRDRHRQGR